jgi:hypothetical protein
VFKIRGRDLHGVEKEAAGFVIHGSFEEMEDDAVQSGLNGMSVFEERKGQEDRRTAVFGANHERARALMIVTITFIAEGERSAADAAAANVMTMSGWS